MKQPTKTKTNTTRKQALKIIFLTFNIGFLTDVETTNVISFQKIDVNIHYTISIFVKKPMSYNKQQSKKCKICKKK